MVQGVKSGMQSIRQHGVCNLNGHARGWTRFDLVLHKTVAGGSITMGNADEWVYRTQVTPEIYALLCKAATCGYFWLAAESHKCTMRWELKQVMSTDFLVLQKVVVLDLVSRLDTLTEQVQELSAQVAALAAGAASAT